MPLFTQVRGRVILRTSPLRSSRKLGLLGLGDRPHELVENTAFGGGIGTHFERKMSPGKLVIGRGCEARPARWALEGTGGASGATGYLLTRGWAGVPGGFCFRIAHFGVCGWCAGSVRGGPTAAAA